MTVKHIKFRRPLDAVTRFWSKVDKSGDCWNWTGSLTNKGYGQFQAGYGVVLAHRVSWLFAHGEDAALCVLHHCDNRRCVRPDHLFLGTKADNNRDMCAKGRHVGWSWRRGKSKLSREQIGAIKAMSESKTRRATAEAFGISESHVGRIVRGEFSP